MCCSIWLKNPFEKSICISLLRPKILKHYNYYDDLWTVPLWLHSHILYMALSYTNLGGALYRVCWVCSVLCYALLACLSPPNFQKVRNALLRKPIVCLVLLQSGEWFLSSCGEPPMLQFVCNNDILFQLNPKLFAFLMMLSLWAKYIGWNYVCANLEENLLLWLE